MARTFEFLLWLNRVWINSRPFLRSFVDIGQTQKLRRSVPIFPAVIDSKPHIHIQSYSGKSSQLGQISFHQSGLGAISAIRVSGRHYIDTGGPEGRKD